MKNSNREKFRYYFENTFASGPIGVIRWLAIMSFITILLLGCVIVLFGIRAEPDATDPLSFLEGAWQSLMATLDSGTMGGDEGWAFRIVRFIATLVGIFMISILIGVISAAIDGKIEQLRKGKSKVLESGHTLILGWSEKIFSIIDQLILANENLKKQRIVVLAEMDKVEMEDAIREKIQDFKTTKIIVRSGNPMISNEIQIVNPNLARAIIVLSPDSEEADITVIKTVMSITNSPLRKKEPFHIVAEIKEEANLEAAELVGQGEAIFIYAADLLARITAQTCRQFGLAIIYTDLFQFEGDEIYFQKEPSLYGKTFKEAAMSYNTSSLIGVYSEQLGFQLNPSGDTLLAEGDSLVALSQDNNTIVVDGVPADQRMKGGMFVKKSPEILGPEKTLMMGWNENSEKIIVELDSYVNAGSELLILAENDLDLVELTTQNVTLTKRTGKLSNRKVLDSVHPEQFDNIILMSDKSLEVQHSDAQTLICLLHLRSIGAKYRRAA
ncbi:MAG: potassium transporter TrkA [Flavobacteriia bacterium]|nr:potassium transporter TrkA [Flavobacteriia bacterium]